VGLFYPKVFGQGFFKRLAVSKGETQALTVAPTSLEFTKYPYDELVKNAKVFRYILCKHTKSL